EAPRRPRRHRGADGLASRQGARRRGPHPHAARGQAADLLGRSGRPGGAARSTLGVARAVTHNFESLETMTQQQILIEKYGAASTPQLRALAPRPPAEGEVAIDVAYSGVNFADIQMRLGFYPGAPKKPFVPGYEVSGRVAAVG